MMQSGYTLRAMLALLMLPLIGWPARAQRGEMAPPSVPGRTVLADAFARADRLSFLENLGQVTDSRGECRPDVLFTSGAGEGRLFFRKGGISYLFTRRRAGGNGGTRGALDGGTPGSVPVADGYRMDLELVGADTAARITAEAPTGDRANFYLPHAPGGIVGAQSYGRIIYHDIYPGIDLRFYGDGRGLKYDFIVAPEGDPSRIRLRYHGARSVTITRDGALRAVTPLGSIVDGTPFSYQLPEGADDIPAARSEVRCRWRVAGSEARFAVGGYDTSRPLVIDPTLLWATYFGGNSAEAFYGYYAGLTVDGAGDIAIAGLTMSNTLPVTRGAIFEYNAGDYDAFVAKFNGSGKRLWATYYGGGNLDIARGIDAGSSTDLAVCGYTRSIDFPLSPAAWQGSIKGADDAFVLVLDGSGQRRWATYFGGNDTDIAHAVAMDPDGNVAITGATASTDFPVSSAPIQSTVSTQHIYHGFIAKFHPFGVLLWSTYYGGAGADRGKAIAAGPDGSIAVAGVTGSPDLPIPPTAHQPRRASEYDAFVTLLDRDGRQRWGSYIGGDSLDEANGVAIDPAGSVVVCGVTESATFPTTPGALHPLYAGPGSDAFIVRFDRDGALRWGTYYGGGAYEMALGIRAASWGSIFVTGLTFSADFPLPPTAHQPVKDGNVDAFLLELDTAGHLLWGTYYGGDNIDVGSAVGVDAARNIYVAGATEQSILPGTSRGFQKAPNRENDAFIAKFGEGCGVRDPVLAPGGVIDYCRGDTVTLTAPEGYEYRWEPNGETTRTIRVTAANEYRVLLRDPSGCLDTSRSVKLREQYRPDLKILSSSMWICNGGRVTLSAESLTAPKVRWSTGDTTHSITITEGGTYTVTAEAPFGCSATASITISVGSNVAAPIIGAISACINTTLYYATDPGPDLIYRWSLLGPGTITGADNGVELGVRWEDSGMATITLVAIDTITGCSSATTLKVDVRKTLKPIIMPSDTVTLCEGESITLDAGAGYASYRWSSGESTRTIVGRAGRSYTVAVADASGCSGTSEPVVVTTGTLPLPAIDGPTVACVGSSMTYTTGGPPEHGFLWTVTGGTIVAGQGTPAITVLWREETRGKVELVESLGPYSCTASAVPLDVAVKTNHTVTIGPASEIGICDGDSVTLKASDGSTVYIWSTGERTQSIVVRAPGLYTVTAMDAGGCAGSDSAVISVYPRPAPRISPDGPITIYEGKSVVLDVGPAPFPHRWSTGETTRTITVRMPGDYWVSETGAHGCQGVSEPVHITVLPIPRGEARIAFPTIDAEPGDTVLVPIRLESSRYLSLRPAIRYNGTVKVSAALLHPIGGRPAPTLEGGEWKIGFNGLLRDTLGTLAEMKFIALLGDSDRAPLRLDSFAWSDSTIDATVATGEVRLLLCGSDGERMVVAGGRLALKAISPDPVHDVATIEYELVENGPVRLTIADMLGGESVVLAEANGTPGRHVARLDASALPSGVYIVTLGTPTGRASALMQVVR